MPEMISVMQQKMVVVAGNVLVLLPLHRPICSRRVLQDAGGSVGGIDCSRSVDLGCRVVGFSGSVVWVGWSVSVDRWSGSVSAKVKVGVLARSPPTAARLSPFTRGGVVG